MRAVFALVLIAGLGLAGFAVYMAQDYLSDMRDEVAFLQRQQRANPELVRVVVVNAPKSYGEVLSKEEVTVVHREKNNLPEGTFFIPKFDPDSEEAKKRIPVAELYPEYGGLFPKGEPSRYVLRSLEAFEPIMATYVTEPGEDAGITSRLSVGMRAFAISVDVRSGVSGFLRPGDRVDVYWTGTGASTSSLGQEVTKLIESGVKLIAVDQTADAGVTSAIIARTITVEATPQQVARLTQAQSTGRLSLSLRRGDEEVASQNVTEVDQNELLGIVEIVPEVVVEERKCYLTINKGGERIREERECTN